MQGYFFKPRKRFDFKANKFDLGTIFWSKTSHLDRLFLQKIRELNNRDFEDFYEYHKKFYLENAFEGKEKLFFIKLYELINLRIDKDKKISIDTISSSKKNMAEFAIKKYEAFINMIATKDKWEILEPRIESKKIIELKKEIEELKLELNKYRIKPEHKIEIIDDGKEAIIDLFHQIQTLPHWKSDKRSNWLVTHSQTTWAKILANYFREGDNDISLDTVRKHFRTEQINKYSKKSKYKVSIREMNH